ncbi:hypothetical protein C3489_29195 [Streptomyces sp. Ru71]|uniref:hypothetical protein n=1 Tax=Streptomyces sp. Ru71 TaxID=2080746 RepID=UPI000CDE381A|nr:hypothetical protein [Streptomyces sp. Ru71]POX47643.1 hypothetical protein C3489_29195 [Streptomyces sp. Ru71]
MWPGQQQPPGGEPNPNAQNNPYQQPSQPGYQQPNPNPYQQPGYQQPNPYGQQSQWGAPTPAGVPQPATPPPGNLGGGSGGGDKNRTKLVAIVSAGAVVLTAAVTGFVVFGGDDEKTTAGGSDKPTTPPSVSASPTPTTQPTGSGAGDNPRSGEAEKATIPGWKVVINPKYGTAFDVPANWVVKDPGLFIGFEDEQKGDGSAYIGMSAPAFYNEKWCTSVSNGRTSDKELAAAGTKGENGAKDTASVARGDSATWAFGGYTDQNEKTSRKYLTIGNPAPFTTKSGLKGDVATSFTTGVPKKAKCDTDGKATTFAFKNSVGNFVAFTFYGVKGVKEEVPDATIQQILSTVRLHGDPVVS